MASRSKFPQSNEESLTGEQVVAHSQNHSTAKQQFSFPKAQRFHCKTQLSSYHFYPLPSTRTKVAAFIGNQKRTLFEQCNQYVPAPDMYSYSIDGQFETKKKKVKGYYMALGRSDIKINNFLGSQHQGPSPLKYYNPEVSSFLDKREYSFSKERKYLTLRKLDEESVGPGSYNIDTSLEEQKQIISSRFKSLCPKFQEVKVEKRKRKLETQPPLYCPMITAKGEKLRLDNNKGVKIGMSKRGSISRKDTNPGPGQYKMFSEFLAK